MTVLVAGASGFVGRRLCPALEEAGHAVRAMTRHPETITASVNRFGPTSTRRALSPRPRRAATPRTTWCTRSATPTSRSDDAEAARAFGPRPPPRPGSGRIVYLGGLGKDDDDLSAHLRSRREVERLLGPPGCR